MEARVAADLSNVGGQTRENWILPAKSVVDVADFEGNYFEGQGDVSFVRGPSKMRGFLVASLVKPPKKRVASEEDEQNPREPRHVSSKIGPRAPPDKSQEMVLKRASEMS